MSLSPLQVQPRNLVRAAVVSVIVPTRNFSRTLGCCLRSARMQTHQSGEIIVVDNFSTDGTREIAGKYADAIELMGPERSAQRNHGARLAHGDYFLFIDSDMELSD